ncbi:hypothetical protein MMC17_004549 [Xylographa soralifera]|nr:hypothetical protein [Xylographa soralifera]
MSVDFVLLAEPVSYAGDLWSLITAGSDTRMISSGAAFVAEVSGSEVVRPPSPPVDPTGVRNGKKAVIFVSQNSNGKKCDYGKKPEKR